MKFVIEPKLNEAHWLNDKGEVVAFAYDITDTLMVPSKKRQIVWRILEEPSPEDWGLCQKPFKRSGHAPTFAVAKTAMAAAMGIGVDLFS